MLPSIATAVLVVAPLAADELFGERRARRAERFQVRPEVEALVASGLEWLARHQDEDGRWDADGFERHDPPGKPSGGKVLSFSELKSGGKTVFYEFETFEARDSGLVLTPYPGGRKAKSFPLTSLEGNKATFENPKNDFPTKLVYHLVTEDNLVITLTDPHNKSDKRQIFDLKRAK